MTDYALTQTITLFSAKVSGQTVDFPYPTGLESDDFSETGHFLIASGNALYSLGSSFTLSFGGSVITATTLVPLPKGSRLILQLALVVAFDGDANDAAAAAAASAEAAATSALASDLSADAALVSQTAAAASATLAGTRATTAGTSATAAATSATAAASSATAAAASAVTAAAVYGVFAKTGTQNNFYNGTSTGAQTTMADGTNSVESVTKQPMMWLEKYIDLNYNTGGGNKFDAGVFYGQVQKNAGSTYGCVVTGSVRHNGGSGQMTAIHGRAQGSHSAAEIVAGWFYVYANTNPIQDAIGVEINTRNTSSDVGHTATSVFNVGGLIGLNISTADDPAENCQIAMYFGAQASAGKWWTGWQSGQDVIVPTNGSGNGEIALWRGGSSGGNAYKGLRFYDGNFISGLEFLGGTFSRNAIEFAKGQTIGWGGSATAAGAYTMTVNSSNIFVLAGISGMTVPIGAIPSYADDAAAASGGLAVGGLYRTGSAFKIRAS